MLHTIHSRYYFCIDGQVIIKHGTVYTATLSVYTATLSIIYLSRGTLQMAQKQ